MQSQRVTSKASQMWHMAIELELTPDSGDDKGDVIILAQSFNAIS
jgi:hypothetical protein